MNNKFNDSVKHLIRTQKKKKKNRTENLLESNMCSNDTYDMTYVILKTQIIEHNSNWC